MFLRAPPPRGAPQPTTTTWGAILRRPALHVLTAALAATAAARPLNNNGEEDLIGWKGEVYEPKRVQVGWWVRAPPAVLASASSMGVRGGRATCQSGRVECDTDGMQATAIWNHKH